MQTIRNLFLLLLFTLPIIFSPVTYLAFELPKILILYFFSALSIYFLAKSGYSLTKLTKIHKLFLIFLLWIIFTSIIGLSFQQSFWGSYFRMQGILSWICYTILFFISGKVFSDAYFRRHVCLAILVSATFTAILALIQFIGLWFLGNNTQLLYSGRVISTFGQPNFLGAYLVMSLPFVWYLYNHTPLSLRARFVSGVAIFIIILGIFSTFSRSAYLGLAILALIWGIKHYKLLLTGIVFSVLLFGALATISPNLVYQQWYRFKVNTISKWTAENRLIIAQKSLKLIVQRPIIGYGIENFSLAFPQVVSEDDLGLKDIVVDSAHNLFLDLGVQTGLIGLGIFLAILIVTIKAGLKVKDDFIKASLCVIISFLIIHQFSPVSVIPMVIFWISLGVINPLHVIASEGKKSSNYIIHFFGISLIALTTFFIIQTIRADILFHQSSAYEVSDINRAIKLDNDAIKIAPWINFYKIRRDFLLKQLGY